MENKSVVREYVDYFFPCVLMAIATQTASIIDKMFIGNLVNPVEMGAANACMPVSQFVYTLSVLIGVVRSLRSCSFSQSKCFRSCLKTNPSRSMRKPTT